MWKKDKNNLSLEDFNKSIHLTFFDKLPNIVDMDKVLLRMNIEDFGYFSKFLFELYEEINSSNGIRQIMLNTAISLETYLDLVIIKIYNIDKYLKFGADEFLSNIDFSKKIKILESFKSKYNKRDKKNKKPSTISFSIEFYEELENELGNEKIDELFKIIQKVEEKIMKKHGFDITNGIFLFDTDEDYLEDYLIDILNDIPFDKLNKIRELRNIISHNWDYEDKIKKKLGLKNIDIDIIKNYCLDILIEVFKFKK